MFDRVLVANRGEIAVRIMRTLRRLGIAGIAVYSDADAQAQHVLAADEAVRLGAAPARESYLAIDRVVAAAVEVGAEAIHPGYGFLSENAAFARACAEADIAFVGPRADVIAAMGDKIAAKRVAERAGVPVVPGRHDDAMDDAELLEAIDEVGLPALLKPAAGGGGKGMRIVGIGGDARALISGARRESLAAFGDDRLLVERYVEAPRHIEVQVLGDQHGSVVHLGERECTLQRRHQKVVEEAPSALLDDDVREGLCSAAVRLARAVGYTSAGTVEFVVPSSRPADFAFLEMNTRLQVEHPVTEAVTGLDLVEWQLRIAAGERLGMVQDDIRIAGHAVEARVYAEDPLRGYLPTGGEILHWKAAAGVRVDAGVRAGDVVSQHYDPMLAKVIAHASTRDAALDGLRAALRETICLGVSTNIDDLGDLLDDPRVRSGDMDTALLDAHVPTPASDDPGVIAAAALALVPEPADSLWGAADAWRLGGPAPQRWLLDGHEVAVSRAAEGSAVSVDAAPTQPSRADAVARRGDRVWLHADGRHREVLAIHPRQRRLRSASDERMSGHWAARSPMPGAVIEVLASVGDSVAAGDPLAVVEAMKMEHTVRAPAAGMVTAVAAQPGSRVPLDFVLVEVQLEELP